MAKVIRVSRGLIESVTESVNKEMKDPDDVVTLYSDYVKHQEPVRWISTGNYAIDRILGGGIPRGRMIEIYGPYSGGKTLLLQEILAQVCTLGGYISLQDIEHTYDPKFGEGIGIDPTRMFYSRPTTVEEAFKQSKFLIEKFRLKNKHDILAIGMDSLAAAPTKHELEELDKADMTKAKSIGAWLRRVTGLVGRQDVTMIIINQTRHKVGIVYGSPETTPGGDAPGFHASQRIRVEMRSLYKGHEKKIYENGKVIAVRIVVDVVKNKLAPPFRRCEVITNFKDGLVPWSGYADLLADEELIKRTTGKGGVSTGQFEYNGKKFRAHEIMEILDKHPEILEETEA